MPLTDAQRAEVRSWVGLGVPPSDADLDALYDVHGSVEATSLAVLRQRLSTWEQAPAKLTLAGDGGYDLSANMASVRAKIGDLEALLAPEGAADAPGISTSLVVRSRGGARRRAR